ncbi:MAG: hypothetical protein PHF99_07835 [Bacteroidales bacterium]|nr:hypothetical protein [Bacteroidales bacterium]MDD4235909.1 hypothetical protein [Bacteroidales bacterium]
MYSEAHKSIDVDVFKEIIENELFHAKLEEKFNLLELVRKVNGVEIRIPGLDIDRKKETANIKFKQFGFKAKTDFDLEFRKDVFENETIIKIVPKKVYELQDRVKRLPEPYCDRGKLLLALLSDSFERLKIKSKNIIHNSDNDKQIGHYAKKNIQMAKRNCYDARLFLHKIQKTKNKDAIFLTFMANIFMINVLTFLQKMFSSYYNEKEIERLKQKVELYDAIDLNVLMEHKAEYVVANKQEQFDDDISDDFRIKVNGQINALVTVFYDLRNKQLQNGKNFLEGSDKAFIHILSNNFFDKKGNPVKPSTIIKCLQDYNDDKRAKGDKRHDIDPYF